METTYLVITEDLIKLSAPDPLGIMEVLYERRPDHLWKATCFRATFSFYTFKNDARISTLHALTAMTYCAVDHISLTLIAIERYILTFSIKWACVDS